MVTVLIRLKTAPPGAQPVAGEEAEPGKWRFRDSNRGTLFPPRSGRRERRPVALHFSRTRAQSSSIQHQARGGSSHVRILCFLAASNHALLTRTARGPLPWPGFQRHLVSPPREQLCRSLLWALDWQNKGNAEMNVSAAFRASATLCLPTVFSHGRPV